MSVDRKLWNIALSALMLTGAACGTAAGKQGPQAEHTPVITPTKIADSAGQAECTRMGVTMPNPAGWAVSEFQISPTFANCYVSEKPVIDQRDFRTGLMVSRFDVPMQGQDRVDYARQIASASQPGNGLFAQANTFNEATIGPFRIDSGIFTSMDRKFLSTIWVKVVLPTNKGPITIARFIAPKSTSEQEFKDNGSMMLDGIRINGQPTK